MGVAGLKLPMFEQTSVRLTVCVPPDFKRALHDYGNVYPSEYGGREEPLGELVQPRSPDFPNSDRHIQCVRHEHRTA
jgi:hypothetical protein